MWVTALTIIVTLVAMLAALGYVAFAARRLDARLERAAAEAERGAADAWSCELDRVRATAVPGC